MSVKPITNRQVVSNKTVRRDEQVSTKNSKVQIGNREQVVTPGLNFDKNYAITLKDVDTAVISHIKTV